VHVVPSSRFRQLSSGTDHSHYRRLDMRRHRSRPADAGTTFSSGLLARHAALADHVPLELRESAEQLQHQTPSSASSIDGLRQASEAGTCYLDATKYRKQVGQTASHAVDFVDHKQVARPKGRQGRIELRPPRSGAALFFVHAAHLCAA